MEIFLVSRVFSPGFFFAKAAGNNGYFIPLCTLVPSLVFHCGKKN
jgi:hypothetical protein